MQKSKQTKRNILTLAAATIVVAAIGLSWNKWFSKTRIGFMNFQAIELGQISKANTNSFIDIKDISPEDLKGLKKCDMLFINGMGLRITEEKRALVHELGQKRLPIFTIAATNPTNDICTVDSVHVDTLMTYLTASSRKNYRSLLNYVRNDIDKKVFFCDKPESAVPGAYEMMYHPDLADLDNEYLGFDEYHLYTQYLREQHLWKEEAPRIIITGQMGEPSELILKLEETGNMVFPVRDFGKFTQLQLIDSVAPSALINMAHGRMGDKVVKMLEERNIPLFSPLNVNTLVEEWEADKMGMSGGFLSQSVVTPEIDGAIRPYALFGHFLDKEGLPQTRAIPERLENFVKTVNNYISLKEKPNSEKKVAIVYYKGVGQSALTASGMEVVPSLYNLLKRLRAEGYTVKNLPGNVEDFKQLIMQEGAIFGTYAEGAASNFMKTAHPALVNAEEYNSWVGKALRPDEYKEVTDAYGPFPGDYMVTDNNELAVSRLDFGNVVLLPQPAAGTGSDTFKMVHGTDAAPTHAYIAPYLWIQYGFQADALIHFGTHGSLEFTPRKQVALSNEDWPDRLVGNLPHYYIYTIGNVGEAMIAKRRSYAGIQSYLTPPFMESSLRSTYRELSEAIRIYNNSIADGTPEEQEKKSLAVKKLTVKMGIHRELKMDSLLTVPYTEEEIARIENFAEEIATEKITGQLYTIGEPYSPERILSSVYAMTVEPIAYSLLALDKHRGKAVDNIEKHKSIFNAKYLEPSKKLVNQLLHSNTVPTDRMICQIAGISKEELAKARAIEKERRAPKGMMAMMMAMSEQKASAEKATAEKAEEKALATKGEENLPAGHPSVAEMKRMMKEKGLSVKDMAKMMQKAVKAKKQQTQDTVPAQKMEGTATARKQEAAPAGKKPSMMEMMAKKAASKPKYSKEELEFANAVYEVERSIMNVKNYRKALLESPEKELSSLVNALAGGYTAPTPGGDPIVNPNTLPTGRNLYAINAEETPTESAWDKGKRLAQNTIDMYKRNHNDSIPRKVSYTLWSGEFIETEGATIAQILYMLGVEPIRDAFGRVNDIRLIPSKDLGRPRIDVVVQTSGQLRDIAASRLFLINRAVEMAAAAKDDQYTNLVAEGAVASEKKLIEKGLSPQEAREISTYRVFGGMNGNYGTGIQEMVQSGDRWTDESEIAAVYLNNMGTFYGSEKNWETVRQYAFEAALTNTDAVIQPRQSNTWGALSLDHVYEFMGGMNLAVRNVTGKDPDAYLSDYRNRNNVKMQELKESIGIESRTTLFNPNYIKEKMKGDATAASTFDELVQNTYGWNVMKPEAVDDEIWDEIYNVYVQDKFDLGIQDFFERANPAALQDMTAVMMETARKGLWEASPEQLANIAQLHAELVKKHKAACTGAVCDNAKLRDYISRNLDKQLSEDYRKSIKQAREVQIEKTEGNVVLKKEEQEAQKNRQNSSVEEKDNSWKSLVIVLVVAIAGALVFLQMKKKNE